MRDKIFEMGYVIGPLSDRLILTAGAMQSIRHGRKVARSRKVTRSVALAAANVVEPRIAPALAAHLVAKPDDIALVGTKPGDGKPTGIMAQFMDDQSLHEVVLEGGVHKLTAADIETITGGGAE